MKIEWVIFIALWLGIWLIWLRLKAKKKPISVMRWQDCHSCTYENYHWPLIKTECTHQYLAPLSQGMTPETFDWLYPEKKPNNLDNRP